MRRGWEAREDCTHNPRSALVTQPLTSRCSPAPPNSPVGAFWRHFTLCQLGLYFGALSHPEQELVCATGEPELDSVLKGGWAGGRVGASWA